MTTEHPHATAEVVEIAAGGIEAQTLVASIIEGRIPVSHAWLAYAELQARHGKNSAACRAYVIALAKAAAR